MDIDVHPCATPDERAAALALRHAVFVAEQGVPAELELDAADADAMHLVAVVAGAVVGAARLVPRDDGSIKVGRVCVRRDARGRGIGRALMAAAHGQARARGARRIVLHAQLAVSGFYRDLGYRVVGPAFVEAAIAHERMELALD
ncbi:MAG TPA: GNAT family N-acetyltransferase [Planctomycetota bacterium]|nr:GNAT family N-acetyltransferase [Planctomycetota bacterium]